MADYNVQMKQYNGTSFDNILPYASQALTLAGGGSATKIIAQAKAGLSQIVTGSYVGNGTTQYSMSLEIPLNVKMLIIYNGDSALMRSESSSDGHADYSAYTFDGTTFTNIGKNTPTNQSNLPLLPLQTYHQWHSSKEPPYYMTGFSFEESPVISYCGYYSPHGNYCYYTIMSQLQNDGAGNCTVKYSEYHAIYQQRPGYPEPTKKLSAETCFNKQGITYHWIAFGNKFDI